MTTPRTVYHVVPDTRGERWLVTQDDTGFQQEFDRKSDAVVFAKVRARGRTPSQVKVHNQAGRMDYESTYG